MSRQIYNEGTSNVKASYSQVNQTFNMFAQRNWNVLSDWNVYLTKILNNDSGLQWNDFVREKEKWHYSDFYLFNEKNQFITIEGRSGVADNAKDAFNELFKANAPVISSYISTKGVRKVLFAYPSDRITVDGISYTGLAVSYDNRTWKGCSETRLIKTKVIVILLIRQAMSYSQSNQRQRLMIWLII
jgi:hypothetical protein